MIYYGQAKADAYRADKKRREDEENQKIKDKARQKVKKYYDKRN